MAKSMIEIGFSEEAAELLRAVATSGPRNLVPVRITGRAGLVDAYLTDTGSVVWMSFDAEAEEIPAGWRKLYMKES